MKKFLPIFLITFFIGLFFTSSLSFAQTATPAAAPDDAWVIDSEVTFVGKNAQRSGALLDFTLKNYNWVCVTQNAAGQCDNSKNPLTAVWLTTVTYIVVPLLFVVVIATALIIIVTRGRSLTVMRFLPRFIIVVLLIFFSFALLQFFYQIADAIQGFFLRSGTNSCPPDCISQKDLLFVGWDYQKFIGLRKVGDMNSESAFISILLTKLTAITYFVMVGILYLRRIILWFFIIVSPIFPLLLLYYPVRNTGKIWIGEFFRWLLYAPLFAIFLKGLVSLWRNQIPLTFANPNIGVAGKEVYPTAVNILLGGPKQVVTLNNSVNVTETFALYVVSLLMLWGAIILPWILLQIFLDAASNLAGGESAIMKKMLGMGKPKPGSPAGHPPTAGSALSLPFTKKFSMPMPPGSVGKAREIPVINEAKISHVVGMPTAQVKAQVLGLANMSLPSMRDIAKYDASLMSKDSSHQQEISAIRQNLQKIANPASATSATEQGRYVGIREKLTQESSSGNTLATSILSAANSATKQSFKASNTQIKNILTQIANPTSVPANVVNRDKLAKMNQSLTKAKQQGDNLAAEILDTDEKTPDDQIEKLQEKIREAREKGEPIATEITEITEEKSALPVVNRVQTVSKDDYDAVRDMWKENYKNLEVPEGMSGTRTEWIKDDIAKIDHIIELFTSRDDEKLSEGMQEVSNILPFLLVGGFSQTEITAYLRAKQDAAKDVLIELNKEEENKVEVSVKKSESVHQEMAASVSDDSPDIGINNENNPQGSQPSQEGPKEPDKKE